MTLLSPDPSPGRLVPAGRAPSLHLVPSNGFLLFPGAPDGIAPPAQLGPMMSPPRRGAALFGR